MRVLSAGFRVVVEVCVLQVREMAVVDVTLRFGG